MRAVLIKFPKPWAKKSGVEGKQKGYGQIKSGLLHYITIPMIACMVIPTSLLIYEHKLIARYFMAGVELNSIIISVFLFGMTIGVLNNLAVYRNARFVRHLAQMAEKDVITAPEVDSLMHALKTWGKLFDTNHMEGCISNINRFGHLNFTDSDARLIKSKLGQRLNEKRKHINFLGGMLVLLGLIGTYTGLLSTVDAVGGVMMKMSHIGDSGSDGMSGFIGALAEPLQGMGLAFSASLFGISGSLLISVFGLLAKDAQNEFVENISRWIDDRIPKFGAAAADGKAKPVSKTASADDLRTWLAGFVNMSVKTNNRLNRMTAVLEQNALDRMRIMEVLDIFAVSQKNTQVFVESITASLGTMTDYHHKTIEHFTRNHQTVGEMQKDMSVLRVCAEDMSEKLPSIVFDLTQSHKALREKPARDPEMTALREDIRAQTEIMKALGSQMMQLPVVLGMLNATQQQMAEEVRKLKNHAASQTNKASDVLMSEEMDADALLKQFENGEADIDLIEALLAPDDDNSPLTARKQN